MKHILILFFSALLFFSATNKKHSATVRQDGVYVGKMEITQSRGSLIEYHYISFKVDGKADTYIMSTADLVKVSEKIKNNVAADYSGEYRINEHDITYRLTNKTAAAENNSFTFYKGKINENGSISLEANFADNTKSTATFEFQNFK